MQAGDPRQPDEAISVPTEDALRKARSTGGGSETSRKGAQRELLLWAMAEIDQPRLARA